MYLVSATPPTVFGESFWNFTDVFKDGLEICILFFQNPEIIFYHFFRIFNLDIFRALMLQICIWSIYLVSATPPTVFGESFWNFTVVFRMVWRYAYCFLRILKLFFLHFNLDIFSSLYAVNVWKKKAKAAFLWFHMRNLSLAGYNCSGGASCMACSFIFKYEAYPIKWTSDTWSFAGLYLPCGIELSWKCKKPVKAFVILALSATLLQC